MVDQLTFPNIKWAQRKELVYVTIDALDVEKHDIQLTDEGNLKFRGETGGQKDNKMGFDIQLFNGVKKDESKWNTKGRHIIMKLVKKDDDREEYWPRLMKDKTK